MTADAGSAVEIRPRDAAAAVGHVLRPASVAVIGTDVVPRPGFRGRAAVVEPSDTPGPVDLAVVAVPAESVIDVARRCAAAGVRALLVLSPGFAETGPRGRDREAELLAVCRAGGVRLVGPGSLGVIDSAGLDVSLAPVAPPAGGVALACQSRELGIAALAEVARRGLGLSSFVSTGTTADLSCADFLRFWSTDPRTEVIGLYLESVGDPRRFGRVARRVAARKPVLAVEGGAARDDLFRHAGVIRTATLGELVDAAALLAGQPLPGGYRVGIVTTARGPGVVGAGACEAAGLRVDPLPTRTRRRLARHLPRGATAANPVVVAGDGVRGAIEALADDPSVDAVMAISVAPDAAEAVHAAAPAMRAAGKPLIAVRIAHDGRTPAVVPTYGTPEAAVRALAHAAGYAHRRRTADVAPEPPAGVDADAAAATLAEVLEEGGGWLVLDRVAEILAAYGVPQVAATVAATPGAVTRAAGALDGELAVKAIVPGLPHRSDVGGVRTGVRGAAAAGRAAREIGTAVRAAGHQPVGYVVQSMAPDGVELRVGVAPDPDWGPVVTCAAAGRAAALLGDAQARLVPLGRRDAGEMVRALRSFPLLDGHRGAPRADVGALEDVLVRIAALAASHPEIAELDCNPVLVGPAGATVVDARIRVTAPRPYPSLG